jgi:hypothetical protein
MDENKCINLFKTLNSKCQDQPPSILCHCSKLSGAYTESISISPKLIQICNINAAILTADSGLGRRCIKTDIVEVHDA